MHSVIHAPASKTLPACFVCWADGTQPNKVPSALLSYMVSPQATAFFDRKTPHVIKELVESPSLHISML